MFKNNIPLKVAIGYVIIAIIMFSAIWLVYSNTKNIIAINQVSREYIERKNAADSAMSALLKDEQENLKQLSAAIAGKSNKNYLHEKVKNLNTGKDSIVVHSKAPQTHEAKQTTVEVMKTRRGFFRRLADAFRKEHAETLSVKQDSNRAIVDSVTTPVNVAENVAHILQQIEKKEKDASQDHAESVNKEIEDLRMVSAKLAMRSANQMNRVHQRERGFMQKAIRKAMEARKQLLWQMAFLGVVTLFAVIILVVMIWRDSKKEREYRESLEAANEEIQRVMNQRERLLLTITHDIKAPAASISGFVDLMGDYVSDPQGRDCLRNIKDSAMHLSHLVASLLDYHQLENGLMKESPTKFSPTRLVAESVEGMRLKAEDKGLSLSFDVSIGKEMYFADAFRIRQILDNLVSNAIKYTDQGGVNISAKVSKIMGKLTLVISVKDTGKGMTHEDRQRVFQAFTRLKSAQGIEGTGLGLSITQELVSLLGGRIELFSTLGKGSTFIVYVPVDSVENVEADVAVTNGDKAVGKACHKFANHKILVLDDDKLQLCLLQEMLRRLVGDAWTVFACNHVVQALTLLHDEHPALMLMDIEMPEMNGTDMIKHVNHSDMTVVAMTAHDTSIKPQLLRAGFDDCLFKPFTMDKLADILGVDVAAESVEDNENGRENKSKAISNGLDMEAIMTFAGGDEEAAEEILKTVRQELSQHLAFLDGTLDERPLPLDSISKAAHKLLPIVKMTKLGCLVQLEALSPERINDIDEKQAHKCLRSVVSCLQDALEPTRS